MIRDSFPVTDKIKTPRDNQLLVMDWLDEQFKQNHKRISVCAPTGSGKSGIAIALLNYKLGMYTSPLNILVDQIKDDFEGKYTKTIKGRAHYPCIAKKGNSTCEYGYCKLNKCTLHPKESRNCKECDTIHMCPCHKCVYKNEMKQFLEHDTQNTNFSMFLGLTKTGLCDPGLVIIDECDDIENFIRLSCSLTLDEYIDGNKFSDHVERLKEHIVDLELDLEENQDRYFDKELRKIQRKIDSIENLLKDYELNKKAWCVTHPNQNKTKYEPITTDRFIDPLLENRTVVMMSATPQKLKGYTSIEVDSPFSPEIRPWKYEPLGKMSYKTRDNTIPKVSQFLSDLRGKTVVHCNSYNVAGDIAGELRILGLEPLLQVNYDSCNPYECKRHEIVDKFKKSWDDNLIMLSVNLARGVDFPEKNITNNVIAVIPWPNPNDELTKAKNKQLGSKWQHEQIANTIMQAYGRVNRNADKTTMTYIVDSNFNDPKGKGATKEWYNNHQDNFYKWFKEAKIN